MLQLNLSMQKEGVGNLIPEARQELLAELEKLKKETETTNQNDKESNKSNTNEANGQVVLEGVLETGNENEVGKNSEQLREEEVVKPLSEQIADLRAAEKAEYAALENPTEKAKKKIYDNYDKLITPLIREQKAEQKAVEATPKEGDTSTTKSSRGMIQNMVFKDGEWQMKFGKDFTKVAKAAQKEAQDAFNEKNAPVAEVKEQASVAKTTSVYVAPFYDAMVETTEDANQVEESPAYKKYIETINSVAEALGIKIKLVATNIGAYTNDDGVKVREVSTKVELETTNIDETTEFAVLMGALAPEVQESTIAAQGLSKEDVGTDKHTGDLITIKVDNLEEAIAIAKKIGLDHTINLKESTIDFIDFNYWGKKTSQQFKRNLGRFATQIKEKGIKYEAKTKPIESRFIQSGADPKSDFGRKDVLERMAGALERDNGDTGNKGEGLLGRRKKLRDAIQEAIRRNNEFIRQLFPK